MAFVKIAGKPESTPKTLEQIMAEDKAAMTPHITAIKTGLDALAKNPKSGITSTSAKQLADRVMQEHALGMDRRKGIKTD